MRPRLPHQIPAVAWAKPRDQVGFLMDKRLGKTACAIEWAVDKTLAKNWLVSAPYSACGGWLDELAADGYSGVWLYGDQENRMRQLIEAEALPKPLFVITNPQGLFVAAGRRRRCLKCKAAGYYKWFDEVAQRHRKMVCEECQGQGYFKSRKPEPTEIALMGYDGAIWDESVLIANPQSQTNKVAHSCVGDVQYKAILSGEYAPEGPHQIFEQMRWLLGSFMGCRNFWNWRQQNFINLGYDWHPKPGVLKIIKEEVAKHCYILSRKAAGLAETKSMIRRVCELPSKQRTAYKGAIRDFAVGNEETKYAVVVAGWCAAIAGGYPKDFPQLHSDHKLRLLMEVLDEYKDEPVVITFPLNTALFAVADHLKIKGLTHSVIVGKTPAFERRRIHQLFQSGKVRRLLCQAKIIKYGLDLSRADVMVRWALPDSWDTISQGMDRLVHPQKKRPLMLIDLETRETTDADKIMAARDKGMDSRWFMRRVVSNIETLHELYNKQEANRAVSR